MRDHLDKEVDERVEGDGVWDGDCDGGFGYGHGYDYGYDGLVGYGALWYPSLSCSGRCLRYPLVRSDGCGLPLIVLLAANNA